jgi:hypothetical protein
VDVDLDDARVGRHLDDANAGVRRRHVALQPHRQVERRRRILDRSDQIDVVVDALQRRHEHAEVAIARLDGDGGAGRGHYLGRQLLLDDSLPPVWAPATEATRCRCRA